MFKILFVTLCFAVTIKNAELSEWNGRWFPHKPGATSINTCDDGLHGIEVDFSPFNRQHNYNYLCLTHNRTLYEPNLQTSPILTEYTIPPAFRPIGKCLNEPLDHNITAFGNFRPLPPKYGSYVFLPAQRWLHSLANGAIVMLYHPCSEYTQRKQLQNLVEACLYRHIISASIHLSAERPFALLAWGKKLELSVIDRNIVMDFIKNNAKRGPLENVKIDHENYYNLLLIKEAQLKTDLNDSELCGFDPYQM